MSVRRMFSFAGKGDWEPDPPRPGTFEVYPDRAGKWRWRLKAPSGQVVATGEAHETEAGARNQCGAVARSSAGAKIEKVN